MSYYFEILNVSLECDRFVQGNHVLKVHNIKMLVRTEMVSWYRQTNGLELEPRLVQLISMWKKKNAHKGCFKSRNGESDIFATEWVVNGYRLLKP